ncbi:MAG: class I SAM-dependent methyltransferase [Nanoarchaeota archaeon]
MNLGRKLDNCRMCDSKDLYRFLDLGFMPPADAILKKHELDEPEVHFPLVVAQCQSCGLTQLTYAVNPELLYGEKYSYESSITETGKKHFFKMANSIFNKLDLKINDLVIDIGSNVGVLLEGFRNNGCNILGIDAAPKIVKIANERGIETWQSLINPEIASKIVYEKCKAKVVCGTNVFAHIDDKKGLIISLKIILDEDGVFVIEAPYLIDLIDNLEYDTIYLDHLEYLSLKPLVKFFEKNGFEVFDVEKYEIHGSSIRVFVGKNGKRNISNSVYEMLKSEEEKGIYRKEILDDFAKKIKKHKKDFVEMLRELKKQNKKIIGISAPAKGNTLLNYCKIHEDLIDYMTEKSGLKPGHYTPGMHIPIIEEEKLLEDSQADYGVIFAWNFAEEIIKNPINQKFYRNGGKFIKPIPNPIIMEDNNEKEYLFGVEIKKIEPVYSDPTKSITDIINEPVKHVGLITNEINSIGGNHYHKLSKQYSYILLGKYEVLLAPWNQPFNVKKIILNAGEIIIIPPKIIHRFKALEKCVMIDIVSESREGNKYEDDTYRIKIEV